MVYTVVRQNQAPYRSVHMQRMEVSREKMSPSLDNINIVAADDYKAILVA